MTWQLVVLILFVLFIYKLNRTPLTRSERVAAAVSEAVERWDRLIDGPSRRMEKLKMSQTKRCPHCGCDTYLLRWEPGKCPHCGATV